MPAEDAQLQSVGGDSDRYDAELRPELMRRAIADIQDAGIEVDVWKIEGVEQRSDCEMLVAQARSGGRDGVKCVVLGRGADDAKVDHWLTQAAPVDGYIGFAIGRSIWWDPLKAYVDGKIERSAGARKIAENYLRFVAVYERAKAAAASCMSAMKMRQSLAEWERAFVKEISLDRHRRDSLRRTTEQRSAQARSRAPSQARLDALRAARPHAHPDRGGRHRRDVPHALPAAGLGALAPGAPAPQLRRRLGEQPRPSPSLRRDSSTSAACSARPAVLAR